MSASIQGILVAIIMPAIYLGILIKLLLAKRWPLRAGLALIVASLLPVLWVLTLPENDFDTPGAGLALVLVVGPFLALALLIAAIGALLALVRGLRAVLTQRNTRTG